MKTKKDAYYFSHDSNAKDDPKCVLLIDQLGLEGYGIFWILVETLRDQPDFKYPLKLIPPLSKRYNTSAEKMKTVVSSYGLFNIENDTFFFSESLNRRMAIFLERRKILSESGKRGAEIKKQKRQSQAKATLKPPLNEVEASKVNKNETKETLLFEEVKEEDNLLKYNPPNDGIERNWDGLKAFLNMRNPTRSQANELIRLSNFGQIGHPIWRLISEIGNSNGGIRLPIPFILSRLRE